MKRTSFISAALLLGLGTLVGTPPAAAAPVRATIPVQPEVAYVTVLYQILLDRAPDPYASAWSNGLANGSLSRLDVVRGIANSQEAAGFTIRGIYERVLDREPSAGEVAAWLPLNGPGSSRDRLISGFLGSDEYYANSAPTPTTTTYLTAVYDLVLGRALDATGQAGWTSHVASNGRADTAFLILASEESRALDVVQLYDDLLSRTPSARDIQLWSQDILVGGGPPAAELPILASDEFYAVATNPA